MKRNKLVLLLLCLPLLFGSCEEGAFGPKQPKCLEIRQETESNVAIESAYSDQGVIERRTLRNGELLSYYAFSYDGKGHVVESRFFSMQDSREYPVEYITYNEEGKWVKSTVTYPNGMVNTYTAEYDGQSQIKKVVASLDSSGTVTNRFWVEYEWEGGNNTRLTYSSPSQQQVIEYEYDLGRENRRRKEQEKTAFLSLVVSHNKNMRRRLTSTVTTAAGAVSKTVTEYSYQYNEEGYPDRVTVTGTTDSGTTSVSVTDFTYSCD